MAKKTLPKEPKNTGNAATLVDDAIVDSKGIDMSALMTELTRSTAYREQYSRDFILLDNLVDGVPLVKEEGTPFVGDTTLAGLVRAIPRQSLKQLPSLLTMVNGAKTSIPAFICNFLLKKYVFNEDTFGKGLLSTIQIGAEQALTHGYAPFMIATGLMYADYGATMRLLHYTDNSLEPGISDANEGSYHFVSAHLTPARIQKILDGAEANKKTSWNVGALKGLLKTPPTATEYARYESDPRKHQASENLGLTYDIVTRYETGPGAKIITFCRSYPDAPLRVMDSKSKWGYPRVQYLVIDAAPLHPFGISRVRLASPNQNLMNIYYANIAAALLINSNPPLLQKGAFVGAVNLKRGARWQTSDPNASIEYKSLDNGALEQFVPMQQQFTGQIQNIMGGRSSSAGTNPKSAGLGKTAPGVEAAQAVDSDESNQITKILENFLRQCALSGLDTLLSEQEGDDTLILDDDTMNQINDLDKASFQSTPENPVYVPLIGADHKYSINWEKFYASIEQWSVEVDVSVSPDQLRDKKRADAQDMLVVLAQNSKDIPGAPEKVQELTEMLMQDMTPLLTAGAPSQAAGGAQSAPEGQAGPKVTETGDLVKLFGLLTDPNSKNGILKILGVPEEKILTVPSSPVISPGQPTAPAVPQGPMTVPAPIAVS